MVKIKKQTTAFYSGIAFLVIGGWMLFLAGDKLGLIPGAIGTILVLWKW